jgi:TonB-dependent SusC/RagA subfamily outer membrane receptor
MKSKLVILLIFSFCTIQGILAQKQNKKIKISGMVTDAKLKPVSGVMIFIDQKKTNSITDDKGFYTVKVPSGAKEISAFSIMNGAKNIEINGKTTINITLDGSSAKKPEPVKKEEEMINIGYGSVSKENLTTNVGKIDPQHSRFRSYSNIYDMLKGEIAGVEVNGTSIRIQGAASFMLSTEPLFIVDGIEVPSIENIPPMDVKSIDVLKGSSASIYGSKGANGVILITLIR